MKLYSAPFGMVKVDGYAAAKLFKLAMSSWKGDGIDFEIDMGPSGIDSPMRSPC